VNHENIGRLKANNNRVIIEVDDGWNIIVMNIQPRSPRTKTQRKRANRKARQALAMEVQVGTWMTAPPRVNLNRHHINGIIPPTNLFPGDTDNEGVREDTRETETTDDEGVSEDTRETETTDDEGVREDTIVVEGVENTDVTETTDDEGVREDTVVVEGVEDTDVTETVGTKRKARSLPTSPDLETAERSEKRTRVVGDFVQPSEFVRTIRGVIKYHQKNQRNQLLTEITQAEREWVDGMEALKDENAAVLETQGELHTAALTQLRNEHKAALETQGESHTVALTQLRNEHTAALETALTQLRSEHAAALETQGESHTVALTQLRNEHAGALETALMQQRSEHAEALTQLANTWR
jgi:hypothetical protein